MLRCLFIRDHKKIIYDGRGGIPGLCWTPKEGVNPGFTLFDLADRLHSRGWQVPAYSMPANRQDLVIQRIIVRHGVSRDLGDLLISDIRHCMDYFKKNPVSHPLTEKEAGAYKH